MSRYFLQLLLLLNLGYGFSQDNSRPVPPTFPTYEFEVNELIFDGHYCANAWQLNPETTTNVFILDSMGYLAWYRKDQDEHSTDFKYQASTNSFSDITYWEGPAGVFYTYDHTFNAIDTLISGNEERGDTHEFLLLENGHKLIGTLYDTIMDLRGYIFNGLGGIEECRVRGFGIQEFDTDNNLIWNWHSTDFVHPNEYSDGLNYYPNDFDYAHGNALDIDDDGNLLVSLRNTSTVYKIDRVNRTGEILWRLGGENSSFTIANSDDRFSAQHYAHRLPNGNIGLYDNGNLRWPDRFSRAAEYSLDLANGTASLVWSYDADQSIYASGMGNAQWLNEDAILVAWGYVFRPNPTMSIVNRAGDLLTALYLEDTYMSYRVAAANFSFDLPRPYLTTAEVEGGVEISAPEGYSEYVWSTGDTTSSIIVTAPGIYQAWVPHGIGLVGSYPVEVSEIVSTTGLTLEETLRVFPNPAKDQLSISVTTDQRAAYSLALYDVAGHCVQKTSGEDLSNPQILDTSSLPAGLYVLRLDTGDTTVSRKVVLLE
mgnify:CR=1 FL=1